MRFVGPTSIAGEDRLQRMRENMARPIARLEPRDGHDESIAVVGFGPSLKDTWEHIRTYDKVCTTSGAHDFLVERGIIPDYHVEYDAREHKCFFLTKPTDKTLYCLASTCHPKLFEQLPASQIRLWHALGGDWKEDCRLITSCEQDGIGLLGGSNAGLRALNVCHTIGFRKFGLFGLDCSYKGKEVWAGAHSGPKHPIVEVECNGRRFFSSFIMLNSADELWDAFESQLNGAKIVVHGDHLFAERVRLAQKDKLGAKVGWWRPVGWELEYVRDEGSLPLAGHLEPYISDAYRNSNFFLHVHRKDYGVYGGRHVGAVRTLIAQYGNDVLDYGCGKRALEAALGFAIRNYDPAIPDCDSLPTAADIVVCTDVLEHVEPDKLRAVIKHLASVTRRIAFLAVATRESSKNLPDGRNTHLIVKPAKWWKRILKRYFELKIVEENEGQFICLAFPKKEERRRAAYGLG